MLEKLRSITASSAFLLLALAPACDRGSADTDSAPAAHGLSFSARQMKPSPWAAGPTRVEGHVVNSSGRSWTISTISGTAFTLESRNPDGSDPDLRPVGVCGNACGSLTIEPRSELTVDLGFPDESTKSLGLVFSEDADHDVTLWAAIGSP